MRSLFIFFLFLSTAASAQVNRSAKELAMENVQQYITAKLFTGKPYKAIAFGEIKEVGKKKKDAVIWTIAHRFKIAEGGKGSFDNSPLTQKQYNFLFYLDEKMKVVRADTWYSG